MSEIGLRPKTSHFLPPDHPFYISGKKPRHPQDILGSFAVVSLMAGVTVNQILAEQTPVDADTNANATALLVGKLTNSPAELANNPAVVIASTLALTVGFIQVN